MHVMQLLSHCGSRATQRLASEPDKAEDRSEAVMVERLRQWCTTSGADAHELATDVAVQRSNAVSENGQANGDQGT